MASQIQDLVVNDLSSIPVTDIISFDYVRKTDVKVKVGTTTSNQVQKTYINDWTITSDNRVQLNASALSTANTTYKVSIYRQTDATKPSHSFQPGSSIRAEDLNNVNKQTLFVADEVRNTLNSLALGSNPTGEQLLINGNNIADDSITSSKIDNLEVKTSDIDNLAVTTEKINNSAVTSAKIADGTIQNIDIADGTIRSTKILDGTLLDVDINASASIQGTKISPDFGSQNITTTGTTTTGPLNAGTTTTGATTSQDLTITNNLTLSSGNADNKGLIFPTNIGGGSGDKAYIRYYVDGTGEDTRLHIGSENDSADDIYLDSGLVHTSGNFTVNGTCTANSFSGDGANLTNLLIGVRQIKETVSNGQSSTTSSSYVDKAVVTLTNVASSSRVLVLSTYRIWSSTPYNSSRQAQGIITVGNSGTFAGNTDGLQQNYQGTSGSSYKVPLLLWDTSNTSGTRTYKIRYRKTGSGTAYISTARIMAIELRPT